MGKRWEKVAYITFFVYLCTLNIIYMNFEGIILGLAAFACIGLFHPIVIKAEYYFGTRCWWIFALIGTLAAVGSLFVDTTYLSAMLGVFAFSWVAIKCRIVQLPEGSNWKAFTSVCMVCGIGLTVSIFIADLSYASLGESGLHLLNQAKLGILCGSFISAIVGCLLLNRYLPNAAVAEEQV